MTSARFATTETPLQEMAGDLLRARTARAQLYIIYFEPTATFEAHLASPERDEVLRDHFRYLAKLEDEARLFGCGRTFYEGSKAGEGMAIVAAASRAEAERIAANEPIAMTGARINRVRSYTSNEGVACYIARAMDKLARKR